MQQESYLYPRVFDPDEVDIMAKAVIWALDMQRASNMECDRLVTARIVFRLYAIGLVEPEKLSAAAALCATSRLFRSYLPARNNVPEACRQRDVDAIH